MPPLSTNPRVIKSWPLLITKSSNFESIQPKKKIQVRNIFEMCNFRNKERWVIYIIHNEKENAWRGLFTESMAPHHALVICQRHFEGCPVRPDEVVMQPIISLRGMASHNPLIFTKNWPLGMVEFVSSLQKPGHSWRRLSLQPWPSMPQPSWSIQSLTRSLQYPDSTIGCNDPRNREPNLRIFLKETGTHTLITDWRSPRTLMAPQDYEFDTIRVAFS